MADTQADGDDELTVLKLGGSVITDKDNAETVDDDALDSVVAAIADSGVPGSETGAAVDGTVGSIGGDAAGLIVVHGGGSFGHVHAAEHGVSTTEGSHDPVAVTAIHGAMKRLNSVVVDRGCRQRQPRSTGCTPRGSFPCCMAMSSPTQQRG